MNSELRFQAIDSNPCREFMKNIEQLSKLNDNQMEVDYKNSLT